MHPPSHLVASIPEVIHTEYIAGGNDTHRYCLSEESKKKKARDKGKEHKLTKGKYIGRGFAFQLFFATQ